MIGIDGPNGVENSLRHVEEGRGIGGVGLVDEVVAGHPFLLPVALGNRPPEVRRSILELALRPQKRSMGRVIRMPITVLVSLYGMQIDDCVDPMTRAQVDGAIEVFETL